MLHSTGKSALPVLNRAECPAGIFLGTVKAGDVVEFQGIPGKKTVSQIKAPTFPFRDPKTQDLTVWVQTTDGGEYPLDDLIKE